MGRRKERGEQRHEVPKLTLTGGIKYDQSSRLNHAPNNYNRCSLAYTEQVMQHGGRDWCESGGGQWIEASKDLGIETRQCISGRVLTTGNMTRGERKWSHDHGQTAKEQHRERIPRRTRGEDSHNSGIIAVELDL